MKQKKQELYRIQDHIKWQFTDLVHLVMVFDYFQSNHVQYPWEMSVDFVLCQKQHLLQAFLHLSKAREVDHARENYLDKRKQPRRKILTE